MVNSPTERQVLLAFLVRLESQPPNAQNPHEAAVSTVKEEIKGIYGRAKIKLKEERRIVDDIVKLHLKMKNIQKTPLARRDKDKNVMEFKENLDKTMKLWSNDAFSEKVTPDPDDRAFLENMMGERTATMAGVDTKDAKREEKKRERKVEEFKRQRSEEERVLASSMGVEVEMDSDSDMPDLKCENDSDTEVHLEKDSDEPKRKHRRLVKTGQTLYIPPDILKSELLNSVADRNKVSSTVLSNLVAALITSLEGGDTSKFNLSHMTCYRYQVDAEQRICDHIMETYIPPTVGNVQWDEKLLPELTTHYVKEDRMPVVVSGDTGMKLLGAPALPPKTQGKAGDVIATATMKLLDEWGCTESIVSMVFDTTSTNTGRLTAGCISIQKMLGRSLIWAACRHHGGERVIVWGWDGLEIEDSTGPEVTVFQRIRSNFNKLSYKEFENLHFLEIEEELTELRDNVVVLLKSVLADKTFAYRGDYLQFMKLALVLLTGDTEGFQFSQIGAIHKARWMAKGICACDMVLLKNKIFSELGPTKVMTPHQAELIERFVKFICLVYIKWWVRCPLVCESGLVDLELLKDIREYPDRTVAAAAEKGLRLQLWYLTQELSPLAMFSS